MRKANITSSLKEKPAPLTLDLCCGWTAAHQVRTCALVDVRVSNVSISTCPFFPRLADMVKRRGKKRRKWWAS